MTRQPFSIEKWQAGWKPVARNGRDVTELEKDRGDWLHGKINGQHNTWYPNGSFLYYEETFLDLFLLSPDDSGTADFSNDEIVVEVRISGIKGLNEIPFPVFDEKKVPPGKYRLTKI